MLKSILFACIFWPLIFFCLTWGSGQFIRRFLPANPKPKHGLPNGGAYIGYLERILIFIFVLLGRYEAIGFLIASKSILRFGESSKDRRYAEYVLLGTLASYLCAIVFGLAVLWIGKRTGVCQST